MSESQSSWPRDRWVVSGLALAAGCLWVWFRLYTGICLEDALITYRYAENLATGHGFVFNEGQRVLGTTTPLLTLMLAFFGWTLGPGQIPPASNVLMILAGIGAGISAHAALRHLGFSRLSSATALLLLYVHPTLIWSTTGGMETPLVVFLMFLSLYALVTGRLTLATVAASALVLTRIDGAAWASLIYLSVVLKQRSILSRSVITGLLVLLPWIAFSFIYFGSPFPNSLLAKQVIRHAELSSTIAAIKVYGPWFLGSIGAPSSGDLARVGLWVWVLFVCLGLLGLARDPRRRPLCLLPLFIVVLWGGYYVGRAPLDCPWYLVPVTSCSLVLGVIGAAELPLILRAYCRTYGLPGGVAPAILTCLLALYGASFLHQTLEVVTSQRDSQLNENGLRRKLGEWLRDSTVDRAVIAMEAIGYQGYYSDRKVLDLAGLVSPEVVAIYRSSASNGEGFLRVLKELRPDYLVLRSFEVDTNHHYHGGPLFASERDRGVFDDLYEEEKRFIAPRPEIWGALSYLTVYRRLQ